MEKVRILLAAHNGEAFLAEMLDSLLNQTYKNIEIIISDDSSTDRTPEIMDAYSSKYPDKVVLHKSGLSFGNAQSHFLHLLKNFWDAPYIMFCDQDDVWHKDKIEKTLNKMKEIERPEKPALVHTDLNVVDGKLQPMHPSFCEYSNIDPTRLKLNQIVVHNVVTGCTVMLNNALARLVGERTFDASAVIMHDWWLAILAGALGDAAFLSEATIDYRQHGDNTVGAQNVRSSAFLFDWLKNRKMKKSMQRCILQAKEFLKCYEDILPEDALALLKDFSSLENKNFIARDIVYLKHKIHKYGFARIVAQYLGL